MLTFGTEVACWSLLELKEVFQIRCCKHAITISSHFVYQAQYVTEGEWVYCPNCCIHQLSCQKLFVPGILVCCYRNHHAKIICSGQCMLQASYKPHCKSNPPRTLQQTFNQVPIQKVPTSLQLSPPAGNDHLVAGHPAGSATL